MNKNVIAFQKGFIITPEVGIDNRSMAMMVQAELMRFGYMLNDQAFTQLGKSDSADIIDFHNQIIEYLKLMTGGMRDYKPIYSGFPQQVMEMSEYELWVNQLIGYWTGGSFTAKEYPKQRGTAFEQVNYKMILPGTEEDFKKIFTDLASAGTSLTPNDLQVISWFVKNYSTLEFPTTIPFKENLCTMIGTLIAEKRDLNTVKLPKLTTTDVLRVVVHMSGGDISLPAVPPKNVKTMTSSSYRRKTTWVPNPERDKFKFWKFTRSERRFILSLLEHSNLNLQDMVLKDQRWIRLGEILHPGEYTQQFPKTAAAFVKLRRGYKGESLPKVRSWYGEVKGAFKMSYDVGLAKLSERAGEFLRQLDDLVVKANNKQLSSILDILARVGMESSNKVLFEAYVHFEGRLQPLTNRTITIKGTRKTTYLPDQPALAGPTVEIIQSTIFSILKNKFALLPAMGDCWIDPELKKIPLPKDMRTLNDALVPTVRGTRIPFGTGKKVIRLYIHWFDERGNQDLDLHGVLFGPMKVESLGFNGRHNTLYGCYSGDVRHRKGACAEYVDIDVEKALDAGFEYFLMIVHNYEGGKLSDLKECCAGVQEQEFPEANPLWKPDTIANSMLLKNSGEMTLVAAFDLRTREYVYIDIDFDFELSNYVLRSDSKGFFNAIAPYIADPKVSVYDLLQWHVEARGRSVTKEAADTHFLFDDFISSYEKTIQYMGV